MVYWIQDICFLALGWKEGYDRMDMFVDNLWDYR
jgi:hypothetical protein